MVPLPHSGQASDKYKNNKDIPYLGYTLPQHGAGFPYRISFGQTVDGKTEQAGQQGIQNLYARNNAESQTCQK